MHPLTGFVGLLLAVVLSLRLQSLGALSLMLGASLSLMLLAPRRRFRLRQWVLVLGPLALGLLLVHGRWGELWHGMPLRDWGPVFVPVMRLWLRIGVVLATALWWLSTTSTERIVRALLASRLPPGAAYLVASPLLLAEQLKARLDVVREAQAARGLDVAAPWHRRWRQIVALSFPLLSWTLSDVGDRAAALEARAFRGAARRTTLDAPVAAAWERWAVRAAWLAMLLVVGSFAWR